MNSNFTKRGKETPKALGFGETQDGSVQLGGRAQSTGPLAQSSASKGNAQFLPKDGQENESRININVD